MCLTMSHFPLNLRFASSTIPVLATYDLELRLLGDTGIAGDNREIACRIIGLK